MFFKKREKGANGGKWNPEKLNRDKMLMIVSAAGFAILSLAAIIALAVCSSLVGKLLVGRIIVCLTFAFLSAAAFAFILVFVYSLSAVSICNRLERVFGKGAESSAADGIEACYATYDGIKKSGKKRNVGSAKALTAFKVAVVFAGAAIIVLSLVFGTNDVAFASSKCAEKITMGSYFDGQHEDDIGKCTYYCGVSLSEDVYGTRYEYYTSDYAKIYKRIKKLEKESETASPERLSEINEQLESLRQKAESTKYKAIVITTYSNQVIDVVYDVRGMTDGGLFGDWGEQTATTAVKVVLSSASIRIRTDDYYNGQIYGYNGISGSGERLYVKVWFSDGSYHSYYPDNAGAYTTGEGTSGKLHWHDAYFGVQLEADVNILT